MQIERVGSPQMLTQGHPLCRVPSMSTEQRRPLGQLSRSQQSSDGSRSVCKSRWGSCKAGVVPSSRARLRSNRSKG